MASQMAFRRQRVEDRSVLRSSVFAAALGCVLLFPPSGLAVERYVALVGGNVHPYTNLSQAATTIQAAIDASSAGDTIWVDVGVYDQGVTSNAGGRSRVVVDKAVSVRSLHGPENTWIWGVRGDTNNQVRCVWLGSNAHLSGFTLINGGAESAEPGGSSPSISGGGLYMEPNARADHCIIRLCAAEFGGGVSAAIRDKSSLLSNCVVEANHASRGGGIAMVSSTHCIIQSNTASGAGGVAGGDVAYSIIRGNDGGQVGAIEGDDELGVTEVRHCLIMNNRVTGNYYPAILGDDVMGVYHSTIDNDGPWYIGLDIGFYHCLIIGSLAGGNGCTLRDSLVTTETNILFNRDAGDYRLHPASPAVDAGSHTNATVIGVDFGGRPRMVGDELDIGAYEFQGTVDGGIPLDWLDLQGINVSQHLNFEDNDLDGYNNWQEFIADTDPHNTNSTFRVEREGAPSGSAAWLTWHAVTGRAYHVQSASPPAFDWHHAATISVASNRLFRYDLPAGTATSQVYRVAIDLLP